MGENDMIDVSQSAGLVVPDLPGTREVPAALDIELVKSVYNAFCDQCAKAGLPRPPAWT